MWPLKKSKDKARQFRVRNASASRGASTVRRRNHKPLLTEAPPSPWLRALGPCALIGVVLGVGGYAFVSSGAFAKTQVLAAHLADRAEAVAGLTISRVIVTGRDRAGREAILDALGAQQGDSILAFDCAAARERLKQISWIADARVRRVLPGDIQVDIDERTPFAVWQNDGRLMLVDATGFPIVPVTTLDLARYPHVVGTGAAEHAAALMEELKSFPEIESRVTAAIRVGNRRWDLKLENGISIELPADDIGVALSEVTRLDREMGVLSSDLVAIDMRFKDRWILRAPPGSQGMPPGSNRAT